jgi:hypothetical protein
MPEEDDVLRIVGHLRAGKISTKQAVDQLGDLARAAAKKDPRFRSHVEGPVAHPLNFRRPADG